MYKKCVYIGHIHLYSDLVSKRKKTLLLIHYTFKVLYIVERKKIALITQIYLNKC